MQTCGEGFFAETRANDRGAPVAVAAEDEVEVFHQGVGGTFVAA